MINLIFLNMNGLRSLIALPTFISNYGWGTFFLIVLILIAITVLFGSQSEVENTPKSEPSEPSRVFHFNQFTFTKLNEDALDEIIKISRDETKTSDEKYSFLKQSKLSFDTLDIDWLRDKLYETKQEFGIDAIFINIVLQAHLNSSYKQAV